MVNQWLNAVAEIPKPVTFKKYMAVTKLKKVPIERAAQIEFVTAVYDRTSESLKRFPELWEPRNGSN